MLYGPPQNLPNFFFWWSPFFFRPDGWTYLPASSPTFKSQCPLDYTILEFVLFKWHSFFFENNREKCIVIVASWDMYYICEILKRCFEMFIKLNKSMRERHSKTSRFTNSQRQFSIAIFTNAGFWSSALRWDACSMAVLILFKSVDELNFWIANLMGSEDTEGFCFHRKNECSAMIAVAEQ